MAKEIEVYGYVRSGQLSLHNQGQLQAGLPNFEGEDVRVRIDKRIRPFSDSQRGYYFGVICKNLQEAILYAWGEKYTINEIDYYFRDKYLYREIVDEDTGEIHREICTLRKGESDVSDEEMREYCRYLVAFSKYYLRWSIPLPLEVLNHQERVDNRRTIAESTATL